MKKLLLSLFLATSFITLGSRVTKVEQNEMYSWYYVPFTQSTSLVHLDSQASLKFTNDDNLPVVDGATALFPLYCSFVEAVYPSDCNVKELVQFSKTNKAYERLLSGQNDIIFVAEPSKEQKAKAQEKGLEFNMYPIGYEAFVFNFAAVNISNLLKA